MKAALLVSPGQLQAGYALHVGPELGAVRAWGVVGAEVGHEIGRLLLPDTLIEYVGVMVVGDGGGQRPNDQRVGLG